MAQKDLAILLSIMSLVTGGFWLWCMKNGDTREMSAMLCFVGTAGELMEKTGANTFENAFIAAVKEEKV